VLLNGEKMKYYYSKIYSIFCLRTWKEYLSYKKELENEKRRVEKMTNDGRDEYDVKKAVDLNNYLNN
jgi:hypothetical protein